MTHTELIKKAVRVHFAIINNQFSCNGNLEDSANMAKDYLEYFLTANRTDGFQKAMKTKRGKIKKDLIERYINNALK